jgi:hypothetical protein
MYRRRDLHREHLMQAGTPDIEDMPRAVRTEGLPGEDRAQRLGGQRVAASRDYGQQPPRAGVSTTSNRTPDVSPSGDDAHPPEQDRRS